MASLFDEAADIEKTMDKNDKGAIEAIKKIDEQIIKIQEDAKKMKAKKKR